MNLLSIFLALLPILVIFLLLVWRRMAADTARVIDILEKTVFHAKLSP
ncbi:MAG: hypothetical protein QMD04_11260 [Anaerolineales bacterium]|nr:hypothetical protein [Anaerolineales bacterium]